MTGARRSTAVISSRLATVISRGITLSPVHMMSMSGANLDPIVFKYSDDAICNQIRLQEKLKSGYSL